MKTAKHSICPICGAACGLLVEVENGKITGLRGDPDDPHSRGHVCPKGMSLPELHSDPDRLLEPMRKNAEGGWSPAGWDAAMDDIAGRLTGIIAKHGPDAVGVYAGDAATHHYGNLFAIAALLLYLDTKNLYTANSLDSLPRQLASLMVFGNSGILPVPDVSRTDYLLIMGGNPVVTNGSIMTAPGFSRHIKDLRRRGGRAVVIDPRRNETALLADEHHFIMPETDALFLLAALHTIFEEGLGRDVSEIRNDVAHNEGETSRIGNFIAGNRRKSLKINGLNDLRRISAGFSPEAVSATTGMAPEEIRNIARDFAGARTAVCYGRMGICAQAFGTTATWLIDALNIVTGNIDTPGGSMFPSPAVDLAELMTVVGMGGKFARWRTRGSELPEFNGELPAVAVAREIETPGPRQIRALITVGGNPAVVVPNSPRMNDALGRLEFMVSLDPYLNASSRHADYILPPTVGLEHDCYPLIPYSTAIRNTAKYAPAAVEPPPGVRHDWEILTELTARLAARRAKAPKQVEDFISNAAGRLHPKKLLRVMLDTGQHGIPAQLKPGGRRIKFGDIENSPSGIDLGLHTPQLLELMGQKSVELAPAQLIADIPRLSRWQAEREAAMRENAGTETGKGAKTKAGSKAKSGAAAGKAETAGNGKLLMTSRRQRRFMNTSLHNIEKLAAGPEQCVLEINPADARKRKIKTGGIVAITTETGSIETAALVTENIMPGVVSLPFGWSGKQPHARAAVSERHPGANVNEIISETLVDEFSGMSAFNGAPCSVELVVAPTPAATKKKSKKSAVERAKNK